MTATSLGQVFIERADPPRLWPFHSDRQYNQDCPNAAGDDRHDRPENRRSETGLEGTELVLIPDENIVDRRDATPHLVRREQLDERLPNDHANAVEHAG